MITPSGRAHRRRGDAQADSKRGMSPMLTLLIVVILLALLFWLLT